MNKVILLLVSFFALTFSYAQVLTPKEKDNLWGFVNEMDSFVIAPKYTAVGNFLSAYTWVNIGGKTNYDQCPEGGKWGVIDMSGKEVCPVKYDYVDLCAYNKVAVNMGGTMKKMQINGGKWGFVDLTTGQEIIPVQYEQVTPFTADGVAWVDNSGNLTRKVWAYESKNEKGKTEDMERCFDVFDNFSNLSLFDNSNISGKWGLVNSTGKMIVDFTYDKVGDFHDNVAWVVLNNQYGMVDNTGKICIPIQYAKLSDCNLGVVWAWSGDNLDKIGLLTKTGKPLTEMKYSEVNVFEDSVAWVKVNNLYVLINGNGKELTQPRYPKVSDFYNGVANVWSEQNAMGCVNKSGKEIARTIYGEAAAQFGVCQFKSQTGDIISWVSHPTIGNSWINQNGKVLARGTKVFFRITDQIPDALWDY